MSSMALILLLAAAPPPQEQPPLRRERLTAEAEYDGIRCAPTGRASAEFHASGRLASCPLALPMNLAGHALPATTWIDLTEAGVLKSVWLPHDVQLQGHLCRGTGFQGWHVTFHPSGALRSCYLAADAVIDGVPCRRGTFWSELSGSTAVHLRDSGSLARCRLSRRAVVNGVEHRRGDTVELPPR